MVKYSASRLLKLPVLDDQGQKIGRLRDIVIETRTGNLISLILDKVDSQVAAEITQQLSTGESVIPVSIAKFNEDSVTVDRRKLKLLFLKRNLKKRTISAQTPSNVLD
ncbi:MAG: PRC-barrel domain-containing protein [Candidatus Atabeyarchaeum deiterrae]